MRSEHGSRASTLLLVLALLVGAFALGCGAEREIEGEVEAREVMEGEMGEEVVGEGDEAPDDFEGVDDMGDDAAADGGGYGGGGG